MEQLLSWKASATISEPHLIGVALSSEMLSLLRPEKVWYASTRLHQRGWFRTAKLLKALNFSLYRCLLPVEADICDDLILEHYGLANVIHPNVTIGHHVRIFHHVTLATQTWVGSPYRIVVEDYAEIGVGAIIVGRGDRTLTIGRNSKVGAGAVVTGDVPADVVVVGVPARPIVRQESVAS